MIQTEDSETRSEAAKIIAGGGVIAFRTDTFYGLGADPLNAEAVRKIRDLKGREDDKPILVLISDLSELDRFSIEVIEANEPIEVNKANSAFQLAVKLFWPGPLTLVTCARADLPSELTAGTGTIGLRLPAPDRKHSRWSLSVRRHKHAQALALAHPPAAAGQWCRCPQSTPTAGLRART